MAPLPVMCRASPPAAVMLKPASVLTAALLALMVIVAALAPEQV
jgi:hypothetical protein